MSGRSQSRLLAASLAGVVVLWVAAIAWATRTYFVDDAYITFRFVQNLWAGQGFVFNPPERIEGLTNLGWALFLIPVSGMISVPAAAKLSGIMAVVVSLYLLWRISRRLLSNVPGSPEATVLCGAASVDFLFFSFAGMETGLAAVLALVTIRRLQHRPGERLPAALLGVALFLVRPEYLLVFPLFLLSFVIRRPGGAGSPWCRSHGARALALFACGVAVATISRRLYFGQILPMTALSKSTSLTDVVDRGLDSLTFANPNLPPLFSGLLALAIMTLGVVSWHRREPEAARFAAAFVAVELLFCVYAPIDWTDLGRYFAPAVPVATLLLALGCREAVVRIVRTSSRIQNALVVGLLLTLAIGGLHHTTSVLSPERLDRYPGYIMTSDSLLEPSRWIARHLPQDAVIASRRIGTLGYVTGRHIYDYKFGLTDAEVARIVGSIGPLDDPRHAALEASWMRHDPDYVLEDSSTIAGWLGPYPDSTRDKDKVEIEIHGTRYRERRRFPIGDEVEWTLLEAVGRTD